MEKFNDKRESLRQAKLSEISFVTNQFLDQRVLGPQTYDTARRLTESDDWEKEIKGLEMIVAISRDSPEVSSDLVWSHTFRSFQLLETLKALTKSFCGKI